VNLLADNCVKSFGIGKVVAQVYAIVLFGVIGSLVLLLEFY
jgi:hypothetical protein